MRMLLLFLSLATSQAQAQDTQPAASRYTLAHAKAEPAPQHGARFSIRARLAPMPGAVELREGENFVLIGRVAKAGVCGPATAAIFRNGFEG